MFASQHYHNDRYTRLQLSTPHNVLITLTANQYLQITVRKSNETAQTCKCNKQAKTKADHKSINPIDQLYKRKRAREKEKESSNSLLGAMRARLGRLIRRQRRAGGVAGLGAHCPAVLTSGGARAGRAALIVSLFPTPRRIAAPSPANAGAR